MVLYPRTFSIPARRACVVPFYLPLNVLRGSETMPKPNLSTSNTTPPHRKCSTIGILKQEKAWRMTLEFEASGGRQRLSVILCRPERMSIRFSNFAGTNSSVWRMLRFFSSSARAPAAVTDAAMTTG